MMKGHHDMENIYMVYSDMELEPAVQETKILTFDVFITNMRVMLMINNVINIT
jgi:hypothetical protein